MMDDRFPRMKRIFEEAMSQPAPARASFVEQACQGDASLQSDVLQLLQAHAAAGGILHTMPGAPPVSGTPQARYVGAYRIIRELGHGGMGVVYLAVRDDGAFKKAVAVKVLRGDAVTADFVERFRQERQVLANLDHPNIARILDGGNDAQGMPFYVMEYVEGKTLDKFAAEQNLSLTDRIRLFQKICLAVQYLHDNRVTHRDLKPGNILIAEDGTPKLLDFGIAKQQVAGNLDLTAAQGRMMTPGYASPEQIAGAPITAASDVYSLGVILYELITGQLPFDNPESKMASVIAGVDPPKPSTRVREDLRRMPETTQQLVKRLIGDLDNVVLYSLRRDPKQRYSSAREFADDLQRYLEGRPVVARKHSIVERGYKFVKRNRVAVAAGTIVAVMLGLGAWQGLEAHMLSSKVEAREGEIRRLLDLLDSRQVAAPAAAKAAARIASPQYLDNVRNLRRAFERDFAAAWSMRPGFNPQRDDLVNRSLRYLESVRPYCSADQTLALEVAAAYQQIGMFQESRNAPQYANRNAALVNFRNATIILNGVANGNSADPRVQGQLIFLAGRIQALGGQIPVYASTPLPLAQPTPAPAPAMVERRVPAAPAVETVSDEPRQTVAPAEAIATQPAGMSQAEWQQLRTDFVRVAAKARIAESAIAPVKESLERSGQTLHPDTLTALTRMQMSVELAKKDLETGALQEAKENLRLADVFASRVLKAMGR